MLMCQVPVLSICLTRDKAQLRWIVMVEALTLHAGVGWLHLNFRFDMCVVFMINYFFSER
jgi:hypothetical protein